MQFRSLKGSYFHVPQDFFLKCVFHLPNRRRSRSVSLRRGQVGPRRAERRRQLLPANMAGAGTRGVGVGAGRGRGGNPKYFFGDSEHTTFTSHNIRFRAVRSDYFLFFRTWSTPQRVRIQVRPPAIRRTLTYGDAVRPGSDVRCTQHEGGDRTRVEYDRRASDRGDRGKAWVPNRISRCVTTGEIPDAGNSSVTRTITTNRIRILGDQGPVWSGSKGQSERVCSAHRTGVSS